MKKFLLLIFILISHNVWGDNLIGIGYGNSKEEAKKEALADLASVIKVNVKAKYIKSSINNQTDISTFIRLTTNITFLNPTINYIKIDKQIQATATINNINDYIKKINEITKDINNSLAKSDNKNLYYILKSLIPLYIEYENYSTIVSLIGADNYNTPILSTKEVEYKILELQKAPTSLEIAAEVLTDNMTENNIYVSPVISHINDEVTPFGNFFMNLLATKVDGVKSKGSSKYNLKCIYAPTEDELLISCNLLNNSRSIKSSVTNIPISLIKSIKYIPTSKNLVSILNNKNNINLQSELQAFIKVSSNNDTLLIRSGETVTLLIKVTKEAYIYMVGYTMLEDKDNPYIFELEDKTPLKFISKKEVGRWVSLGKYKVAPPLGTETIQIFAVTEKPKDYLPKYAINNFNRLNISSEQMAKDILKLFNKLSGEKSSYSITVTTIGAAG